MSAETFANGLVEATDRKTRDVSNLPGAIKASLIDQNNNTIPVLKNYINGQWVESHNTEYYIEDTNPATAEVIAYIPRSDATDVHNAVTAAKASFDKGTWKKLSTEQRATFLEKIADKIEQNLEKFAQLESRDTGKPISLARTLDIPRAISNFRYFAGAIRHTFTECHSMNNPDALNYTVRHPIGVAGLITPWNLPLYLLTWKVAPALAMGNSVVIKPSELTPLTANALAEVIHEVGLPAGAFNLIQGYGFECGQALIEHPKVSLVSFTGGTATGERVARAAAPAFKKLSLELGGKNPTIVFADADFDKAIEGAKRAAFANQGQVCLCGSRILVERSIYQKFADRLVEKVKSETVIGDPSQPSTTMGSLISLPHRAKVESYIELAKQEGGVILTGGKRPDLPAPFDKGAFLEPTIIAGLSPYARTCAEEIFGPVVVLIPFDTDEEAIEIANCVRYGLSASVWTTNLNRAHKVSEAIESGMVWVNTWLLRDLRVPFGGIKDSGVGREGGRFSLEFYSESKNICIHLG